MPRHDLECTSCSRILPDRNVNVTALPRCYCGGETQILWTGRASHAAVNEKERAVVWEHPLTGEVKYPGRNDVPMPTRYQQQGYQRRELSSLREVERFEKSHGVSSEVAWYDRGSGRGFDD